MQAVRRRVIGRFGGEHERHRRQRGGVVLRGIHCPTSLADQQLGPVQRSDRVGERMGDRLVHPDRLAERLPHYRVAGTDPDGRGSQPDQRRGAQHADLVNRGVEGRPRLAPLGEDPGGTRGVPRRQR